MMKKNLLGFCLFFMTGLACAESLDSIRVALVDLIGSHVSNSDIIESPMPGVYQVDLGERVVFISKSGDHILLGDVFDTKRQVSLAEEISRTKVLGILDGIAEDEMIIFPSQKSKAQITVYTDVDCAYCRKLHKEVPTLVKQGLTVRYVWFPRAGIDSPSYDKAVSVWCADDQLSAMNEAKLNNSVTSKSCKPNPVQAQYESGQKVGVRGTPTIVLEDGSIIGGYLPAKDLLARLGLGIN